MMRNSVLNSNLLVFIDKLSKLLKTGYKITKVSSSFVITFSKGFIIKKDLVKISQAESLVGIDIYLDNIKESYVPEIDHLVSHIKKLLEKKGIIVIVNKIII